MMEEPVQENLPDGVELYRVSSQREGVDYYSYCPAGRHASTPVLVCVHGITRNSHELLEAFLPFARQHGFMLLVPHFSSELFPDYQRLGARGPGQRADQALQSILSRVQTSSGVNASKIHLFGFSGGAQFAHRFAMLCPHQIKRMVLVSAGWYTFPDFRSRFPFGLRADDKRPDMAFVLPDLLAVPTLVMAGSEDIRRDPGLRKSAQVDARQGLTRVERGRRWVRSMAAAARHYNIRDVHQFQLLPGAGHEFSECAERGELMSRTVKFLELDATIAIQTKSENLAES